MPGFVCRTCLLNKQVSPSKVQGCAQPKAMLTLLHDNNSIARNKIMAEPPNKITSMNREIEK